MMEVESPYFKGLKTVIFIDEAVHAVVRRGVEAGQILWPERVSALRGFLATHIVPRSLKQQRMQENAKDLSLHHILEYSQGSCRRRDSETLDNTSRNTGSSPTPDVHYIYPLLATGAAMLSQYQQGVQL
jgi:hypothetical protein